MLRNRIISLLKEEALSKVHIPEIKKTAWRKAITDWAKKGGFKKLGSGGYGAVFYREGDNYVVKIFTDKAYLRWVQICSDLKGNPWIPVFKGKPVKLSKEFPIWEIRLEKLSPAGEIYKKVTLINKFLASYLVDNYGVSKKSIYEHLYKRDSFQDIMKDPLFDEPLMEVMDALGWYLTKGDNSQHFTIDMHYGNFMKRGSQLVIVDPLAPILGSEKLNYLAEDTDV